MEREYAVLLERAPHPDELVALLDGVQLDDGPARLLTARPAAPPREVAREPGEAGHWLRARVGEGRKREVRRLFAAVGLRVTRLVRVRLGPLTIRGLCRRGVAPADRDRGATAGGPGAGTAARARTAARGWDRGWAAGGGHRRAVRLRQEHHRLRAGAADRRHLRRHRAHVSGADPGGAGARHLARRRRGARPAGEGRDDHGRAAAARPGGSPRDGAARLDAT